MRTKVILPSIIGNILEWYDFSLYGYFAVVFAKLFFPSTDPGLATLMSFGVFAVGFLTRPIGAVIFGYLGDRYGRKMTLAYAIILMALSTMLIGLLPTYDHIGRAAAILLVLCRLAQGLAVSGEFTGTMIYIIENAHQRRGWYGSLAMASTFAGLLLGSLVSTLIINFLTETQVFQWGWRIPFIGSILLGIVGLYLRLNMPETPLYLKLAESKQTLVNPIHYAFKNHLNPMLKALGLTFLSASAFYITFVYFSVYLKTYLQYNLANALTLNTLSMLLSAVLIPVIGRLSDRFGRKRFIIIGATMILLGVYPLLLFAQHATLVMVLITQLYLAIAISFICGIIPVILVELFITNTRYTALSLPFNLSQALFGGTVPLVMTFFINHTGDKLAPAYYLILASSMALLVLTTIKESYHDSLQ